MIYIFYILAALLVWFSYRSFRGGLDYLAYFQKELSRKRSEYTPFATVFAPCKGMDAGLEENLSSLLGQDYPYEVVFVVDDESDPAVSIIEKLMNRRDAETQRKEIRPRIDTDYDGSIKVSEMKSSASLRLCGEKVLPVKIVVASKAAESSQKVENLREAVLHSSDRSEVFVFVDSDARPTEDWLRNLIAPLADERIGAATGYRWFVSERPTFASELRNMWNASIASALGPNEDGNFCWGGSMAIRRETFERLSIRDRWKGTLSDDFTATRAMNEAGLKIKFVPQALTPTIENCSLREMFEFTTRQMKITRVYAERLWLMSFLGSGLFIVVMATAFLIVLLSSRNTFAVWFSIATLLAVAAFSIAKSTLRLLAVRSVLTGYSVDLRKQLLYQNVLWLFAPALFFINCMAALLSRRITWRGTTYEMRSATETAILREDKA